MQQYNIFQAFVMSFYSKRLYRDVAVNWGGKAFLYLLMLLALSWVYATFQIQSVLNVGYQQVSNEIVRQIPILTIKNGKISTPENRPYIITDPQDHETIAVIDTTGHYKTLEQAKAEILITQTELITQEKKNVVRTDNVPTTLNYVIEPQKVNGYMVKYLSFAWLLIFPFLLFCNYLYRIMQALVYALIGKVFALMFNVPLSYSQLIQLAMVAITPALILFAILDAFNLPVIHELFYSFTLSIAYLFYGIIANKHLS